MLGETQALELLAVAVALPCVGCTHSGRFAPLLGQRDRRAWQ